MGFSDKHTGNPETTEKLKLTQRHGKETSYRLSLLSLRKAYRRPKLE